MTAAADDGAVQPSTARRLHTLVAADQRAGRLPSVVAGVVRDGWPVWVGSRGERTGGPEPSSGVQYRIGSITKTLTAVLVLQLREEGLVDLNDRLEAHLPGTAYGDRTVRSLLSHSSGMHSEPAGSWWERSPGGSFDRLAAGLTEVRPPFPAGATYHYSNVGFGLLGELVARRLGISWWQAVEGRILRPLAMARTSYLPVEPAATGYSVHHFAGTLTEEPATDTGAMAPAGQLWSTVEDLGRYAAFLAGGHPDVLPDSVIDEMATPQSGSLVGAAAGGYGLGLRLARGGSGMLVGHTGSMPGFLAGLFVDRRRGTGAVVLANATIGMRAEGLPVDLLETLEELEPTPADTWVPNEQVPAEVAEVLGVWHWGNTALAFCWDGSEIVVTGLGNDQEHYRFRPVQDGFRGTRGYHHGELLRVVRGADGTVHHLVCATFVYTRTPYDRDAPIPGGHP